MAASINRYTPYFWKWLNSETLFLKLIPPSLHSETPVSEINSKIISSGAETFFGPRVQPGKMKVQPLALTNGHVHNHNKTSAGEHRLVARHPHSSWAYPPIGNTHFSGHTGRFNFFCQTRLRMPPDAPRVVGHFHKKRQKIHQKYVKICIFHQK